jgi:hypothetical protein
MSAKAERISQERAVKKWEPVFREKRAKSKNLEPSAIRLNRRWLKAAEPGLHFAAKAVL